MLLSWTTHKFYFSETLIEWKDGSDIQVTIKVFADDWALATNTTQAAPDQQIDTVYLQYIQAHFMLEKLNGDPLPIQYIGYEKDGEFLYLYLEVADSQQGDWRIQQGIMTELFNDQKNLVNYRFNGETKSLYFFKDSTPQKLAMTKKERAAIVIAELEKLYPNTPIPLDHHDPYTLLIAVLLSAQCTDKKVNEITPHLFSMADNPTDMIQLSVEQIRKIIQPCGLSPAKSKAIHRLSEILIEKHQGKVPQTFEDLEALPGVGHKTASVVMSQAFGVPAFPVDTHIHRLMTQWKLTSGKNVTQTEKDAKRLFPIERWNKLHLQIIFYGREFSPARGPKNDYLHALLFNSAPTTP